MEDGAADFASPPCQRGVELAEGLRRGDSFFRPAWRFHLGDLSPEAEAELGAESLHRLRRSPSL